MIEDLNKVSTIDALLKQNFSLMIMRPIHGCSIIIIKKSFHILEDCVLINKSFYE